MKPSYSHGGVDIFHGDVREVLAKLPDESVHCVVTSPPYWGLRDYGCEGQLGLEATPAEYLDRMVSLFGQVRRVLRADGTLWVNMGDSYVSQPNQRGLDDLTGAKQATNVGSRSAPSRSLPDLPAKNLVGMPWRLALGLQADGWYLRCDVIWNKPNPMPESVDDRPTKSHEYVFLLSKNSRYHYDAEAIKEDVTGDAHARGNGVNPKATKHGQHSRIMVDRDPRHVGSNDRKAKGVGHRITLSEGYARQPQNKQNESFSAAVSGLVKSRNKRSVWTVATQPFPEAHFATFPEELIKPCILAGCPAGGTVLDPFFGSGTTGLVARANGCKCIGIELNAEYIKIAAKRLAQDVLDFAEVR